MDDILDDSGINPGSNSVQDNKSRAKNAMIFLGIIVFIEIISLFLINSQSNMLAEAINGNLPSQEEAEANDANIGLIGIISAIFTIIGIVFFIMWMRRAYANLNRAGVKTESEDSVAAWSWFVPIYNFYKPVSIIVEIWGKTQIKIKEVKSDFPINLSLTVIGAWWATWVLSGIMSSIANFNNRSAIEAFDIEGMLSASNLTFYATIISIISGILGIMVVKAISEKEDELRKL
jgi:hypothetical protein